MKSSQSQIKELVFEKLRDTLFSVTERKGEIVENQAGELTSLAIARRKKMVMFFLDT